MICFDVGSMDTVKTHAPYTHLYLKMVENCNSQVRKVDACPPRQ